MTNVTHIGGGQFQIGRSVYGTDFELPFAAELVGWSLRRVQRIDGELVVLSRAARSKKSCDHRSTDGSVDCRDCSVTAMDFITAASDYLYERAR